MAALTALLTTEETGRLKAELQSLRRKGAIRATSADFDSTGPDPDRSCGRCRIELGRVINRGAYCRACRLKVCKGCREYSFRTTDWVCTVCHKHMEIQAASGEWMNEFVRRPSRRRDNRVYVPAADIIIRTLRRSWTISNPTPRWNSLRDAPEMRPYNSLPRGRDVFSYPSLVARQKSSDNPMEATQNAEEDSSLRRGPAKRSHSEDVYSDRNVEEDTGGEKAEAPAARVNPLIRHAAERRQSEKYHENRSKRRFQRPKMTDSSDRDDEGTKIGTESPDISRKLSHRVEEAQIEKAIGEKRVSFGDQLQKKLLIETKEFRDAKNAEESADSTDDRKPSTTISGNNDGGNSQKEETADLEASSENKDDPVPIELCDIEPLSGTVFRKVTVRRRRQDMRKMQAVDNGWRRPDADLLDILLPEGDDYKLVFISSDSSSKEEDVDDNDSSSTASSFPVDDCDWDYFEPGANAPRVLNWGSPFGSPGAYRRGLESPVESPLVCRKRLGSGTTSTTKTTDDERRIDSESPASSDYSFSRSEGAEREEERKDSEGGGGGAGEGVAPLRCVRPQEKASVPTCCRSCGCCQTQFVPFPVPVPIPVPIPQESFAFLKENYESLLNARMRFPRSVLPIFNHAALIWPLIGDADNARLLSSLFQQSEFATQTGGTTATATDNTDENATARNDERPRVPDENEMAGEGREEDFGYHLESERGLDTSSDESDDGKPAAKSYNVSGGGDDDYGSSDDDALPSSEVSDDGSGSKEASSSGGSSSSETDSDDTGTVADRKTKFSCVYVVNDDEEDEEGDDNGGNRDDYDDDDVRVDGDEGVAEAVVLKTVRRLSEGRQFSGSCDGGDERRNDKIGNGGSANDFGGAAAAAVKTGRKRSEGRDDGKGASGGDGGHSDDFDGASKDAKKPSAGRITAPGDRGAKDGKSDDGSSPNGRVDGAAVVLKAVRKLSEGWEFSRGRDGEEAERDGRDAAAAPDTGRDSPGGYGLSELSAESSFCSDGDGESDCDDDVPPPARPAVPKRTGGGGGSDVVGSETRPPGDRSGEAQPFSEGKHAARYTSLVMITREPPSAGYPQVSVVTSDTTRIVGESAAEIVVRHANLSSRPGEFFDAAAAAARRRGDDVKVITGADTLSAVVCLEEGLADDDSWVENLSHDDDDDDEDDDDDDDFAGSSSSEDPTTLTNLDQEDELRGYHRAAIDFTLHTIVEESCEESEVEQAQLQKRGRPISATDLEKYFYYGLGDGTAINSRTAAADDALSETSSICSESLDSLGGGGGGDKTPPNEAADPADLASSRLEKYFLSGFMGFKERRDSDGSVGSDSEGKPSPEQRRKRLVRARGTGRSHSSSLDNLLANPESGNELPQSEDSADSDSDTYDETNFDKSDGQFDTVKRKKQNNKKQKSCNSGNASNNSEDVAAAAAAKAVKNEDAVENGPVGGDAKGDGPEDAADRRAHRQQQQQRDSGFVGSSDDLIKDQTKSDATGGADTVQKQERPAARIELPQSTPPITNLTRKDSFNNWSSDEETNLMMCKMRQFFKTMVNQQSSKPTTPVLNSPKVFAAGSPRAKRSKPPQLVYFENELTRLMKTVPGIRDDQVREIVEYLSSEDTWSDSYDSSDYTSSDLEGPSKSALQRQISDSCQEIISKFDKNAEGGGGEGEGGDAGSDADGQGPTNRETAFVYQKLVASIEKIASGDDANDGCGDPHNSPPLIAKVMHHIGKRLVALMHEVSSGESHCSGASPRPPRYHRRTGDGGGGGGGDAGDRAPRSSSTTEDDDSTSDGNAERPSSTGRNGYHNGHALPRSRSHDLLLSETRSGRSAGGGGADVVEERETSDCERFSWRGSFESALLAADSRGKLSSMGEHSNSASALAVVAAKRRSAGDLLFAHKSLSREQLDRVRSCGSIGGGGGGGEDKLWAAAARPSRRRASVPDAACASGDSADEGDEDDDEDDDDDDGDGDEDARGGAEEAATAADERPGGGDGNRSTTLPRSLQSGPATTNSLPRLPAGGGGGGAATPAHKAHGVYHFLQQNVKSARYRPPGFSRMTAPKRALSAPGLQPPHQRRGGRRCQQAATAPDDPGMSEAHSSPTLASRGGSKSATPSPIAPGSRRGTTGSLSGQEWRSNEDDIDKLVAVHHNRSSLSSLGLRSDSMASVYSGAGEGRYGTVAVRGQVEFGLQYNYKTGALEILVRQCRDLAAVDVKRNRSDPYVKVYLLPDKSKSGKRKTKVKKHTLNPVFDECLRFHITLNGLETRTLWLTVWHSDMFGRNDFLGEVTMALENKIFDDPTPKWYNLQERTEPFDDMLSFKGDILVGLKFVPPDMTVVKKGKRSRGALHILVKEAKSLTAVKANGTSDPFCKSYLLPDKGRSSKQKTSVIKKTVNPVWNHTFVYDDVTLQELAERCLELTVWDHDRLASNEFLGGVRFSLGTGKHYGKLVDWMDATGKEVSIWKSMLERPNFWVEGCLSLRPSLDNRMTQ